MPRSPLSNWESVRGFGVWGDSLASVREQPHRGKHRTEVTEEKLVMSLNEVLLKLLPLRKIRAMLFSPADCGVPANNFGHNLDPPL
jgi:hypothetical protein